MQDPSDNIGLCEFGSQEDIHTDHNRLKQTVQDSESNSPKLLIGSFSLLVEQGHKGAEVTTYINQTVFRECSYANPRNLCNTHISQDIYGVNSKICEKVVKNYILALTKDCEKFIV